MRKFLVYLLLFIVCIAGTTCFIYVYEDSTRVSASVGVPKYVNAYEDFQLYHYDLNEEYFYLDKETELYTLNKTYPVKTEFNGEEYSYNIMLNNVPCYRMSTSAGKLYSEFNVTYKDLNNESIGSTYLTIEINFYISEVTLKITASNDDNYGRFLEYLKVNGLVIDIVEGQLNDIQTESSSFDGYYVKVLNADGSINKVFYCKDGALVYQTSIPTVGGTNLRKNDITLENGQHQRQEGWTDGENIFYSLEPNNFSENTTLTPYYENYFYVDYYIPFLEDMTVYGVYAQNKYDIKPGETHTLLTYYPEYEGYTFLGWSTDKENVISDSSIIVNEDINLYAVYEEEVKTETLSFNTNISGRGDYSDGSTKFLIDTSSLTSDNMEDFNTITINIDSLSATHDYAMNASSTRFGEEETTLGSSSFTLVYNEEAEEYQYLGCGKTAPAACFYTETKISNLENEGYYYTGLQIKFSDDYHYYMPIFAKIIGTLDNIQITILTLSSDSRNFNFVTFYGWFKVTSINLNNVIYGNV